MGAGGGLQSEIIFPGLSKGALKKTTPRINYNNDKI
jgi:hypothetical protein